MTVRKVDAKHMRSLKTLHAGCVCVCEQQELKVQILAWGIWVQLAMSCRLRQMCLHYNNCKVVVRMNSIFSVRT